MSRFVTTIATLAAVGAALPACTQIEKVDDDGMAGPGIPAEVQRAFDDTCAIAGCHDSGSRQGGLDLTATAAPSIIGGMSMRSDLPLVELGNVQGSFLALKLLPDPPDGLRMPIGGDVDGVDNAIILGWIAGATLPGGEGGESDGGSTTDGGGQTSNPGTDESSTGDGILACGLADVAPDAPNPFDIGMSAGQIPPDVGEVLTNNCGCHEVDAVIEGAFLYTGVVHFSTLAELQADYSIGGTDPPRSGVERLLERMESTELNRMPPPYYCDLGDGTEITDADRQLLIDWLTAGAPDAPTWMP